MVYLVAVTRPERTMSYGKIEKQERIDTTKMTCRFRIP